MAGVKNTALLDLIQSTLEDLPEQEFEVMWTNNAYEFCRIYQNERMEIDGGTAISRRVMLDNSGNARYRRVFDVDTPTVGDVMSTVTVPWTTIGTNYSWDVQEIIRNKSNAKGFIKIMTERRTDGLWALADLIEERAWKAPDTSTDDLNPYGVPYYLSFYTDDSGTLNTSPGAFNGQAVGFGDGNFSNTVAGIDADAEDKWRNYCGVYTAVDNALLKTFRLAFMKTNFKVPLIIEDPSDKSRGQKRTYASQEIVADLMDLADQRDDNHNGKDVLGNLRVNEGGLVTVNRLPVVPINQLSSDDVDYSPIYTVDFSRFKPIVQEGYWMNESEPISGGVSQHTVFTVFLDGSHNNLCLNRRTAGFVLHKAT